MDFSHLRPLRIADILDVSFDLYKEKFGDLFLASGLFLVLTAGVAIYGFSAGTWTHLVALSDGNIYSKIADQVTGYLPEWVWVSLGPILLTAPFAWSVSIAMGIAHRLRKPFSLNYAVKLALKRLPSFIVLLFMLAIINMAASIVCGIGLILTIPVSAISTAILVNEFGNPFKALGYAFKLIFKDSGQIISSYFCVGILIAVGFLAIYLPVLFLTEILWKLVLVPISVTDYMRSGISHSIAVGCAALLIAPYVISFVAISYLDLKIRVEAYDMRLLADDLGYEKLSGFKNLVSPVTPIRMVTPPRKRRGKNAQ